MVRLVDLSASRPVRQGSSLWRPVPASTAPGRCVGRAIVAACAPRLRRHGPPCFADGAACQKNPMVPWTLRCADSEGHGKGVGWGEGRCLYRPTAQHGLRVQEHECSAGEGVNTSARGEATAGRSRDVLESNLLCRVSPCLPRSRLVMGAEPAWGECLPIVHQPLVPYVILFVFYPKGLVVDPRSTSVLD